METRTSILLLRPRFHARAWLSAEFPAPLRPACRNPGTCGAAERPARKTCASCSGRRSTTTPPRTWTRSSGRAACRRAHPGVVACRRRRACRSRSALDIHAESETRRSTPRQGLSHAAGRTVRGDYSQRGPGRVAVVIEFSVDKAALVGRNAYRALVRTRRSWRITAWAPGWRAVGRLAKVAASAIWPRSSSCRTRGTAHARGRFQHGALDLETVETRR